MSKYKEYSDTELLQKIAKYDSRALEELYDRYSQVLFTVIKKIAPGEEATEKTLVDVFTIIWRKAGMFNSEHGSAYTWLITLARNKAIDDVRRSRSSQINWDEYDDNYEDFYIVPTLSDKIDDLDFDTANRLGPKVEEALNGLSDAQKYVIHLAYYEGYTMDEIAGKLNIPLETVRAKITTALHVFRDNLVKG